MKTDYTFQLLVVNTAPRFKTDLNGVKVTVSVLQTLIFDLPTLIDDEGNTITVSTY